MKRILAAIIVIITALSLSACGFDRTRRTVSEELGLELTDGEEILNKDTHGSFGEGMTLVEYKFSDDSLVSQLEKSSSWKSFPLDDKSQELIYGISDENGRRGPFITENGRRGPFITENGSAVFPEVNDGYYRVIDRDFGSYTVGIYDDISDILYYCKYDF